MKKEFDLNTYNQIINCLVFYADTKNHKKNQETKISHIDKDFGNYAKKILKKIDTDKIIEKKTDKNKLQKRWKTGAVHQIGAKNEK